MHPLMFAHTCLFLGHIMEYCCYNGISFNTFNNCRLYLNDITCACSTETSNTYSIIKAKLYISYYYLF